MTRRSAACVVLGAAVLCGVSCEEKSSAPAPAPAPVAAPPSNPDVPEVQVHTVRGKIERLPEADKPASSLQIHHEAINDYVSRDGKRGMNAMVMPFSVGPGVSLEGLAVGDIVEFTWELRKSGDPRSAITAIKRLPPETELTFGKAGG